MGAVCSFGYDTINKNEARIMGNKDPNKPIYVAKIDHV